MEDKVLIREIMILLKKKSNCAEQLLNYTNDMRESMSQNDFDTLNMLLDIRSNLMSEMESYDQDIQSTLNLISIENKLRISCQMSDLNITSDISFEEDKIRELYLIIKSTFDKISELDRYMAMQIDAKSRLLSIENS